eukprot:5143704-Amphidinium_carterae.1
MALSTARSRPSSLELQDGEEAEDGGRPGFAHVRHIAGCNTPVAQLRAQLKVLWQEAFAKDEIIADKTAQQWASRL